MNDEQLNQLFATVRRAPPDTARAELGFETRLLARLRERRQPARLLTAWAWRLAPVFAAVVIALGAWNLRAPENESFDLASALGDRSAEQLVAAYYTETGE